MKIQLPVHSYELRSRPASSSKLVNCFAEQLPPGARNTVAITRAPGINSDPFGLGSGFTVGDGPIKGMYAAHIGLTTGYVEYLYVVSGSKLYFVTKAGAVTLIGDVGTPTRIDMASNTTNLVVVNEPRGYYWDGTTFGEIVDDDFTSRGAGDVEFIDDFLLFREPDSGRFFGGDLGSVTEFNALQFAIADSAPENLVRIISLQRLLIAFGSKSGELWENTGIAGFPFERIINATFEEGCLSPATVAIEDNSVYWVSDDFSVRRLDGITPFKVSTHAIDQALAACTASTLRAMTYDQNGHFFYVLTADEGTWVFDITTQAWHERKTHLKSNWSPGYHAKFAGLELVGDSTSNKIGSLEYDTVTDFGSTQRMEWTYQPIYAEGRRVFHDRLEIILETGIGTTTGQGSTPMIMLQYSDDGGKTWVSLPDKELGPLGERVTRVVWTNLGSSTQRSYRAAVSDPVQVTVIDTLLEGKGGRL